MNEPLTALQVLKAARDYLSGPDRWCQGSLRDSQGRRCLAGAIRLAFSSVPALRSPPVDEACRAFGFINEIDDITSWNDASGRTCAEVIVALDKAIAFVEAK